jgi:hypothetical protein
MSDIDFDEIAKTLHEQQAQLEAEIREMESQGLIMDMGPDIDEVKDWRDLEREARGLPNQR